MKRIAVTFLLLAGLSGCITYSNQPFPADRYAGEKSAATPGASTPTSYSNVPSPTTARWDVDAGRVSNNVYTGSVNPGNTAGRLPANAMLASVSGMPSTSAGLPATPVPVNAPPVPATVTPASLPSLVPIVTTPKQPAVAANSAVVQAGPATVVTANGTQSDVEQASFTTGPEPKITETKVESSAKRTPASTSKGSSTGETKVVKGGTPLMRLINTKRITLNFEVNDIGPSGLAGVDLWYTQDCRNWKKYEAPPQAKAYVVEVDEEGMYGFTLVARSGIGLAKDPPAAGDQPQVWVIVDLTKPNVQLGEMAPSFHNKLQQVAINWKASDKNLGRQPISLYYSDKEEGPWKVIASNLPNTGKYLWQVPSDASPRFFVRAEALDLAGNVGKAQTPKPVMLDTRVPSVSILNVDSANR